MIQKPFRLLFPALAAAASLSLLPSAAVRAADHGDAPSIDHDSGADLADDFLFLDPNDKSRAILAMTVHGFIVPGEAPAFATFDPKVKFVFKIDNTGDAFPDKSITVTFSEKTSATAPQTAKIKFSDGFTITAPTTPPTLASTPNAPVVTTDQAHNISFFAGEVDDPFFFDLVAFNRFVGSVQAGSANPAVFERGRDTFAGYNVLAIALSVPVEMLRGSSSTIGLVAMTRRAAQTASKAGGYAVSGSYVNVDRVGNPAVNVALIPFARKDEYNAAKPKDDAAGTFATDIVASLKSLGTNQTYIDILAGVAVAKGDFLHLNLDVANTGPGGGSNTEAGFPNGRRLGDDTIDTILTLVANGTKLSDNVDASDVPLRDSFPFFAPPHQPLDNGEADDSTRN